jgi:hypothetical protein
MKTGEAADFLRKNIDPLKDANLGDRYRAAAHLIDGTYLPCVVFERKQARVDLAVRRFKELRWKRVQYRIVVESFVAGGSRVAECDLETIELSPFAWPIELMQTIHGETTMGWTAFVVEMKDGTMHSYGTDFRMEFFDLPRGYAHSDILRIHSGMSYTESRGLEKFSLSAMTESKPLREKPYFTCYLKEL